MTTFLMFASLAFQCLFFGWIYAIYEAVSTRKPFSGATSISAPLMSLVILWGVSRVWSDPSWPFVFGIVVGGGGVGIIVGYAIRKLAGIQTAALRQNRNPERVGP